MSWAAVAGAGVSLIGGWLGGSSSPKTPKFNYGKARENLAGYMDSSFDLYENFDPTVNAERVNGVDGATQALNFNAQNLDNYQNMASTMNQGAMEDRLKMVQEFAPQWANQRDIADKSNMAMMKGEIPLDAQQATARSNAYKSFQSGTSGTVSGRDGLLARDLGMTSLNLIQRGQDNAQSWLRTNKEIAMPSQVGAGDVMSAIGFNSGTAIGTMEGNANRKLSADQISKTNEWNKMQGVQDIYGTQLESENALLSQQLTDEWGKLQGSQAQNQNMLSGISGAAQILSTGNFGGGGGGSSGGGSKGGGGGGTDWGSIIGGVVSAFF